MFYLFLFLIPFAVFAVEAPSSDFSFAESAQSKTTPGMFDILIVGSGYYDPGEFRKDAEKSKTNLLTYEPFRSLASNININIMESTEDFGCHVHEDLTPPRPICDEKRIVQMARAADMPYDKIVVLANGLTKGGTFVSGTLATVGADAATMEDLFVHELAHALGLLDEYVTNPSSGPAGEYCNANCCYGSSCSGWSGTAGAQCLAGCTYPNWYRSSENSIMRSYESARYFNKVSEGILKRAIENYLETSPPEVILLTLSDGETASSTVTVIARATDNGLLKRMEFYVDDEFSTSTLFYGLPWENSVERDFIWDTKFLPSGAAYSLSVKAYDLGGNVGESAPVSLIVDRTSPTIAIISPVDGAVIPTIFQLKFEIADNVKNTRLARTLFDGEPLGFSEVIYQENNGETSVTMPIAQRPGSRHTLILEAIDQAGNIGRSQPVFVEVAQPIKEFQPLAKKESRLLFTITLRRGMSGEKVKDLQMVLAQMPDVYPEGLVTGYFGPLTEAAIKRFQVKYGIVFSGAPETTGYGLVGPRTRTKLNGL